MKKKNPRQAARLPAARRKPRPRLRFLGLVAVLALTGAAARGGVHQEECSGCSRSGGGRFRDACGGHEHARPSHEHARRAGCRGEQAGDQPVGHGYRGPGFPPAIPHRSRGSGPDRAPQPAGGRPRPHLCHPGRPRHARSRRRQAAAFNARERRETRRRFPRAAAFGPGTLAHPRHARNQRRPVHGEEPEHPPGRRRRAHLHGRRFGQPRHGHGRSPSRHANDRRRFLARGAPSARSLSSTAPADAPSKSKPAASACEPSGPRRCW